MRIAFVCPVFPPEPAPAGRMAFELSKALAADGHEVTVFTQFPNRPLGRLFPGYRRAMRSIEQIDGFKVVRCFNWIIDEKRRIKNRVLENISFGFSSAFNLLRDRRPDLVILETWPLFATEAVLSTCKLWHVPVVNYVQDCYPEVLEYTGHLPQGGYWARKLRSWDRRICMRSSAVIAISSGMKALLYNSRLLPESTVTVIHNWLDAERFPRLPRDNDWRQEVGIAPEQFLVLYAGTMGQVSGVQILVEVARRIRVRQDIVVVCVGEGILKQEMQDEAERNELRNIRFLPLQPAERVAEMHAAADATVLTTKADYPDASVPSKLISYLAAGRPVVCAAHEASTVAQIVRNASAGVVANPGETESVVQAITFLADHPTEARQLGINARDCFEDQFTFASAYERFMDLLGGVDASRLDDRLLPSISRSAAAKRAMPPESNATSNIKASLGKNFEPFRPRFEELSLTVAYSRQDSADQRIDHEAHDRSGQNPL